MSFCGASGTCSRRHRPLSTFSLSMALLKFRLPRRFSRGRREAGKPYEAVVALGCVIRGDTGHYDIVAGESARALMDLSVARRIPLANGILTVENDAQAWTRARVNELNKGGGAAEAALALLRIKRQVQSDQGQFGQLNSGQAKSGQEAQFR